MSKDKISSPSLSLHLPISTDDSSGAPTFRSAYSPPLRVALSFPADGRTKQSFKNECDINIILSRYLETGVLDHVRQDVPQFIDCTQFDYTEAMNLVADANTAFFGLPAGLRDRFNNDPQALLEFVHDPRHEAEAIELGLIDGTRLEAIRKAQAPSGPAAPVPGGETPIAIPPITTPPEGAKPPNPGAKPGYVQSIS